MRPWTVGRTMAFQSRRSMSAIDLCQVSLYLTTATSAHHAKCLSDYMLADMRLARTQQMVVLFARSAIAFSCGLSATNVCSGCGHVASPLCGCRVKCLISQPYQLMGVTPFLSFASNPSFTDSAAMCKYHQSVALICRAVDFKLVANLVHHLMWLAYHNVVADLLYYLIRYHEYCLELSDLWLGVLRLLAPFPVHYRVILARVSADLVKAVAARLWCLFAVRGCHP
eukprot:IDg2501t1